MIRRILYSKGKNIILFDTADLYEDNYVLEDAYNILEKYHLDSAKYLFRLVSSYKNLANTRIVFHVNENSKIIYGPSNINKFNIIFAQNEFQKYKNILLLYSIFLYPLPIYPL